MAIEVRKTMLKLKYSWETVGGDDPTKTKEDRLFFNRREGYEVLSMINKVVKYFNYHDESGVHKVEAAIANLPGHIRSRENVFNWLVKYLS